MSGGTDTEAPPKPPKSLARDESLAGCFLSVAGTLRALVDGAGEHAAQLGLGRLAHLHVAALHHQPLEIHEVLGPVHDPDEDLADVPVAGMVLEQLRVPDPLGRLLADEEVPVAAHDL